MPKEVNAQLDVEQLSKLSLLQGLSNEEILQIKSNFLQEKFLPNELIIEENEHSTDVYLIIEGEVNILKWDEEHLAQVLIGKLGKGEPFGEMSFMDASPRSTTIKAAKPTILLKLARANIGGDLLSKIYANIAILSINRLRNLNKGYVKNLQDSQRKFQVRQTIGKFVFYQYLIFGLIVALLSNQFSQDIRAYIPWIIATVPAILLIRSYQFTLGHFGLHFKNWIGVIFASLLTSGIVVGILYVINHVLQTPIEILEWNLQKDTVSAADWAFFGVYCLSIEFFARGILQTSLEDFLHDEKGFKSVFINALFLYVLLLPIGYEAAMSVFIISIPMGLIYLKQRTILGVFLIHALLMGFGVLKF